MSYEIEFPEGTSDEDFKEGCKAYLKKKLLEKIKKPLEVKKIDLER